MRKISLISIMLLVLVLSACQTTTPPQPVEPAPSLEIVYTPEYETQVCPVEITRAEHAPDSYFVVTHVGGRCAVEIQVQGERPVLLNNRGSDVAYPLVLGLTVTQTRFATERKPMPIEGGYRWVWDLPDADITEDDVVLAIVE